MNEWCVSTWRWVFPVDAAKAAADSKAWRDAAVKQLEDAQLKLETNETAHRKATDAAYDCLIRVQKAKEDSRMREYGIQKALWIKHTLAAARLQTSINLSNNDVVRIQGTIEDHDLSLRTAEISRTESDSIKILYNSGITAQARRSSRTNTQGELVAKAVDTMRSNGEERAAEQKIGVDSVQSDPTGASLELDEILANQLTALSLSIVKAKNNELDELGSQRRDYGPYRRPVGVYPYRPPIHARRHRDDLSTTSASETDADDNESTQLNHTKDNDDDGAAAVIEPMKLMETYT